MVSSSWTNDKVVWCLDDWQKRAKLDGDEPNFLKVEFDSVVVKVKVFKIADSSSSADLFLDVLLDRGNVCEPEVVGATE
jgi:hypothetical protein